MAGSDAKRSRFGHSARDIAAATVALTGAAALVARFLPVDNHAVLIAAALSPYLMVAGGLSGLLLLRKRPLLALLPALLLAAVVAFQVPQLTKGRIPENSIPIRVLTANLRDDGADPAALAAAAGERADVLFVQELSPGLASTADRLLKPDFPYQALHPGTWAAGVGVWSRYPIVQSARITRYILGALTATLRVPGVGSDIVVASVHLVGPWPQPVDTWREEIAALPDTLEKLAAQAGAGAVIVAGDLNATADQKPFRRLLATGFRDARGWAATYPDDTWLPALIRIDHILTHNGTATDARSVRIPGSDHRGLAATVHVPT